MYREIITTINNTWSTTALIDAKHYLMCLFYRQEMIIHQQSLWSNIEKKSLNLKCFDIISYVILVFILVIILQINIWLIYNLNKTFEHIACMFFSYFDNHLWYIRWDGQNIENILNIRFAFSFTISLIEWFFLRASN